MHTEVVIKLVANSDINAIVRFAARSSSLKKLFSDNASIFTRADKREVEKINEKIRPSLVKIVFTTVIAEAEAVVNRRPSTALSTDSRDGEALTPLHSISPEAAAIVGYAQIKTVEEVDGDIVRRSWKGAQVLLQKFRKAFCSSFVSMMHIRPKWKRVRESWWRGTPGRPASSSESTKQLMDAFAHST